MYGCIPKGWDVSNGFLSGLSWLPYTYFAKIRESDSTSITIDMRDYKIEKRFRLSLPPGDGGLSRQLRTFGFREPLNCQCYVKFVEKEDRILDIGSNIGYFVLLGSNAKQITCVEPLSNAIEMLKVNIEINDLADKCAIVHAAVGPRGKLLIEVSPHLNLSKIVNKASPNTHEVDSVPLVDLVAKYQSNMVRLDVEGYEYEILYKNIPESVNKLSVEFHSGLMGKEKSKRLLAYLEQEGFRLKYFIEDVPLRLYPFVYVFRSTGMSGFMSYIQRDAQIGQVQEEIFSGRSLKYLYLER